MSEAYYIGMDLCSDSTQISFYNDISRETTITPAQWKAKVEAGEWFIYAEPKVAYNAENGIYELRVKKTPCKCATPATEF